VRRAIEKLEEIARAGNGIETLGAVVITSRYWNACVISGRELF
jgi:hypothetical protein